MEREKNTKLLSVGVPEKMYRQLTFLAKTEGSSVSAIVRDAIQQEISRRAKEELEQAAEKMAPIYSSDGELVAFSMLVGEWPLENHHGMLSDEISLTKELLKERARELNKEEPIGQKRVVDD